MNYETILDIGERKREKSGINEDSIAATSIDFGHRDTERTIGVFVIADGAGGHQDGDAASYLATDRVLKDLVPSVISTVRRRSSAAGLNMVGDEDDPPPLEATIHEALEDAVLAAHRDILEYAGEAKAEPVTTVVTAVCIDDRLYYAWVGDSRAYVINRSSERISLLTRDHSKIETKRRAGEISDAEAEVHVDGNQITRALGGSHYEDPETSKVDVASDTVRVYADDLILLTSDGLIDAYLDAPHLHHQFRDAEDVQPIVEEIMQRSVTDDEIRDIVLSADSLEAGLQALVNMANERGGKDNLSIVLADELPAPPTPETLPSRGIRETPEDIESQETIVRDAESDSKSEPT